MQSNSILEESDAISRKQPGLDLSNKGISSKKKVNVGLKTVSPNLARSQLLGVVNDEPTSGLGRVKLKLELGESLGGRLPAEGQGPSIKQETTVQREVTVTMGTKPPAINVNKDL